MTTDPRLSTARRRLALFTLALGGFGIGVTEFATMGLLPQIAADLVPGFADHPQAGIAHAGVLISVYALGVVIGAPLFASLGARASQTRLAFLLLSLFIIGTVASAFMPTFGSLAIARFVAALPHGAYFGVAALLAGRIMGPGNRAKGVALALSGLTIANVVGVPIATWIGQFAGWRSAYILVAVIFAVTLVLGIVLLPRFPGNPERSAKRELAALKNYRVWLMIGVGSVGFGGFFAVYSYIAEVSTRVVHLDASLVPWVLATLGLGMTIGNVIGGWWSDRNLNAAIVWGMLLFTISLALYAVIATTPVGLYVSVFFVGTLSSVLNPAIQSRLIRVSHEAQLLGAAMNHSAFNIGNSLGAWLGGLVIAAGFGYLAPGWLGVVLALLGLGLILASLGVERHDKSRNLDTVGLAVEP